MSLKHDIYEYIKSGETTSQRLGLEVEHFIVDKDGFQIPFDEVTHLIEAVGKEIGAEMVYIDGFPVGYYDGRYSVSLEPSCQFEISINPYSSISEIEKVYKEFISLWEPIFRKRGYSIVAKGNLPLVECGKITPDDIPLSPKKRYEYMDAYFRESGHYGKYMMRASASTQVSIDYKSEDDLVRKLRVLQKIAPMLMIMMESKTDESAAFPGNLDKLHLFRIQEWDDLDRDRTGFFPGAFEPGFGYEKISDVVYHIPLILLTDNGETIYVGHKNAEELVSEHVLPENVTDEVRKQKLVEHLLSMSFFHFRIKKYIEIRIADSVPVEKALGYAALLKGIVYSDKNMDMLEDELSEVDGVKKIQDVIYKIEREGLDAIIYKGKTAAWWGSYLIGLARQSLPEHEREYLSNV